MSIQQSNPGDEEGFYEYDCPEEEGDDGNQMETINVGDGYNSFIQELEMETETETTNFNKDMPEVESFLHGAIDFISSHLPSKTSDSDDTFRTSDDEGDVDTILSMKRYSTDGDISPLLRRKRLVMRRRCFAVVVLGIVLLIGGILAKVSSHQPQKLVGTPSYSSQKTNTKVVLGSPLDIFKGVNLRDNVFEHPDDSSDESPPEGGLRGGASAQHTKELHPVEKELLLGVPLDNDTRV